MFEVNLDGQSNIRLFLRQQKGTRSVLVSVVCLTTDINIQNPRRLNKVLNPNLSGI